jgi:hypothetical protein
MDFGTCSVHSWNDSNEDEGDPGMGRVVDEKLQRVDDDWVTRRLSRRGIWDDDDDELL